MKTKAINSRLEYERPYSYEVKFRTRRVFCQSPIFGNNGEAGDILEEDGNYTYDL